MGGTPTAVATRVGSGHFAAATLVNQKVSVTLPSGEARAAIAYVCAAPGSGSSTGSGSSFVASQYQYIHEVSSQDGLNYSLPCLPLPQDETPLGQLTATVDASAIPGVTSLSVFAMGSGTSRAATKTGDMLSGQTGNFSFNAPAGSDRVLVLARDNSGNLLAVRNFASQAVPGALHGGSTIVLDANDLTIPEAVSYANLLAGYSVMNANALVVLNTDTRVVIGQVQSSYPAFPASALQSGDRYVVSAFASTGGASSSTMQSAVSTTQSISVNAPITLNFPTPWNDVAPVPSATPGFPINYTGFAGGSNLSVNAWIQTPILPPSGGTQYSYSIETTSHAMQGATVSLPDLSGISGFYPPPASGNQVLWTITLEATTGSAYPDPDSKSVLASGIYTTP
jgi:hypothetical protein